MRRKYYVLLLVFIAAVYFYNTVWFQAFFMYDRFYKDIANVHFDVTQSGNTIDIPLGFKYNTCYDLSIKVPGEGVLSPGVIAQGRLGYKFRVGENLLAEGISSLASHRDYVSYNGHSRIVLMVFDLPFAGEENVVLRLEVVEPFSLLSQFKGHTYIGVSPDYNADLCNCYNEDRRIEQPE